MAITRHMYESALHILRRKHAAWQPRVLSCSALEQRGIEAVWLAILDFKTTLTDSGDLEKLRQRQALGGCKSRPKPRRCTCCLPEPTLRATSSKRYRR